MQKVKDENSLIETFFEKIETFKKGILAYKRQSYADISFIF